MRSSLFGQFLLERSVIDVEQLKEGLEYQRLSNRLLGKLAVEKGFLKEKEVHRVIERQWSEDKEFGKMAVEMGLLSYVQLEELLNEQESIHVPLGEALVRTGIFNRDELKKILHDYSRSHEGADGFDLEDSFNFRENPALCFFNVLSRVLPRVTGGWFIPGGFYPTIAESSFDIAISQRVHGDLEFEVVLLLTERLFEKMGLAVLNGGGEGAIPGQGKVRLERAVKEVLNIAVRHFIHRQSSSGIQLTTLSNPRKASENTVRAHRRSAGTVHCVEVLLISPPEPKGDFLQFDLCLFVHE